MTALILTGSPTVNQIKVPASINTLEKMVLWSSMAYEALHGGKGNTVQVFQDGSLTPRTVQDVFRGNDGLIYVRNVTYQPVNSNFFVDTSTKPWEKAIEISTAIPDTAFNA
jgi:hypothetical protein